MQAPRSEALTILGSLVCFPNTYREIPLLQSVPEVSEVITGTEDIKVHLTNSQVQCSTVVAPYFSFIIMH